MTNNDTFLDLCSSNAMKHLHGCKYKTRRSLYITSGIGQEVINNFHTATLYFDLSLGIIRLVSSKDTVVLTIIWGKAATNFYFFQ